MVLRRLHIAGVSGAAGIDAHEADEKPLVSQNEAGVVFGIERHSTANPLQPGSIMQFIHIPAEISPEQQRAWAKIAASTDQADPFCCTAAWQLSFHETFSPKRRLLIEATAGSRIAFAEMFFSPQDIYLTPIETGWLFGCPLLGGQAVELLTEAIEYAAGVYRPFFPALMISGIRPGGTLARRLLQVFNHNYDIFLYAESVQCAASLAGGVDGFLSRRSANHRSKLKKAARQALEKGVRFERIVPSSPEESRTAFSRMLAVEHTSWKGIGRCGMTESPARQFYTVMLDRLSASKEARVIFAKHEDKDIGFIFGGMVGKIYRGQQFSYDERWKIFSIGNILQLEQIAWLCEENAERYDMGPLTGPRMHYKAHWTEKEFKLQTWILRKR